MNYDSTRKVEIWPTLPVFVVLFVVAFWIRLHRLQTPFFGDQSLYYYLSYTLGFGPTSVSTLEPLTSHVVVRPFMYVFFFPWARLGFTAFRLANIVVGSAVPGLVFLLSVKFRANHYLAAAIALITCLHNGMVEYSVRGFPDMLTTALMLCGYLAYYSKRWRTATVVLCFMVLSKEAYAMFLMPLLLDGSVRWFRYRSKLIIAPIAALVAVFATNGYAVLGLHARMQGWSKHAVYDGFFSGFLWTYWYIPVGVLLLVTRKWQVLAIALAAPIFFLVWGCVLRRGVEDWYIIGPLCVALVATTVALQSAVTCFQPNTAAAEALGPRRVRFRLFVGRVTGALLTLILILPSAESGWLGIASLTRLIDAFSSVPKLEHAKTLSIVEPLKTLRPRSMIVVDMFWA